MFEFLGSPVPVRNDLKNAHAELWAHLAAPGPTLTGDERVDLAHYAREAENAEPHHGIDLPPSLCRLAAALFAEPATVDGPMVRASVDESSDAMTVEVISIVSMLAAVDGTHHALNAVLEPLPTPRPGGPNGEIAEGMKRRRTHVPMPQGAIPMALDLLPRVGSVFRDSFGPQYMTGAEMTLNDFARDPGLNRAQIEIVSSRTSLHNKCFY